MANQRSAAPATLRPYIPAAPFGPREAVRNTCSPMFRGLHSVEFFMAQFSFRSNFPRYNGISPRWE